MQKGRKVLLKIAKSSLCSILYYFKEFKNITGSQNVATLVELQFAILIIIIIDDAKYNRVKNFSLILNVSLNQEETTLDHLSNLDQGITY